MILQPCNAQPARLAEIAQPAQLAIRKLHRVLKNTTIFKEIQRNPAGTALWEACGRAGACNPAAQQPCSRRAAGLQDKSAAGLQWERCESGAKALWEACGRVAETLWTGCGQQDRSAAGLQRERCESGARLCDDA